MKRFIPAPRQRVGFLVFGRGRGRGPWFGDDRYDRYEHERRVTEGPLDVAERRYAYGDIGKADFEQIKKDLSS